VSPRAVSRGGVQRSALPVLDLWKQEGWREAESYARDGYESAMAGSIKSNDRRRQDGCDCDYRLLRTAEGMARRAEQAANDGDEIGLPSDSRDAAVAEH